MNISNEDRSKIVSILNELTKSTFQLDYNKSESYRILMSKEFSEESRQKIIEILQPKDNVEVYVYSLGMLKIGEKTNIKPNSYQLKELHKIESENIKLLPYKYVMGGKIGKKDMLAALYKMV